jgi:hypothetical protein
MIAPFPFWRSYPVPSWAGRRAYRITMYLYADDSTKGDFTCLAAYFGRDSEMGLLHEKWAHLLDHYGIRSMHASEFMMGQPQYRELTVDDDTKTRVLSEFCSISKEYADHAVVVSTSLTTFRTAANSAAIKPKYEKNVSRFLFLSDADKSPRTI